MKILMRCLSILFALLALGAAVFGICLAIGNRDADTVLVTPAPEALATADRLVEALSQGDYEAAEGLILGSPDLGIDREPESDTGKLLWNAWQESLTFTATGDPAATDSGIARTYAVRYLDIGSVTANLKERSQALLEKRVKAAKNMSEVYDKNHEYREDFVMKILYDATVDALKEDAQYTETTVTVSLVFREEKWWALPDENLLNVLSGSFAG